MPGPRMKKADLRKAVGSDEPVAVGYWGKDFPTNLERAQVLAIGETRRVFTGARGDWGGHPAHDGIRVRYLDERRDGVGSLKPAEEVVGPQEVRMPWAEYLQRRDAARDAKDAEAQRLEALRLTCESAAKILGGSVRAIHRDFTTVGYELVLSPSAAAAAAAGTQNFTTTNEERAS